MQENFGGCEGVAAGAMAMGNRNREMIRNCIEAIVIQAGKHAPRKPDRAEVRIDHAMAGIDARDLMIQEAGIKRRVVCDQHGIADEIKPARRDISEDRSTLDHLVCDAGQTDHETRNGNLGINEREKLIDDAAVARCGKRPVR